MAVKFPLIRRIAETARLMVGVGSYEKYLDHMHSHHPVQTPMTETEYFRYGQDSRYPTGKNHSIKRCPC